MSSLKYVLIFFSIFSKSIVECSNILYVGAMPSPSHYIWNKALALGLVAKGHNVTFLTPDEDKAPGGLPANFSRILLDDVYDTLRGNGDLNYNELTKLSSYEAINMGTALVTLNCKLNLASKGTKQILNYPDNFQFDIIIYDITLPDCLFPLMKKFNYPPAIAVSAMLLPTYASFEYGSFLAPSIIPWYASTYSNKMTLMERISNTLITYYDTYVRQKLYKSTHELTKSVFGEDIPSFSELHRRITLFIANSDPILDYPQPVPPNFIMAGGLHTRKGDKLPEDLQKLLDNAKDGAIIFSLGTNVRSDLLGNDNIKAFLDAFSKLKQTVLWKFESNIENLPNNVIVRKWLPQNDLLAHPNVRLLLGHGGALSTQESLFHGVPMVLLPFFVDQHANSRNVAKRNLGVKMDLQELNADYIFENINKVLNNKVYAENAKKAMKLFKDRQETPLERAVFWIENVIRNGGAEHLNTPVRDMPFYAALNIDVVLILLLIVFTILLIALKLVSFVYKILCQRKNVKIKVN